MRQFYGFVASFPCAGEGNLARQKPWETGGQCPPLRMGLSTDLGRRGDHWSPVFLWFPQHSPVGLTQKICWYDVKAPLKYDPSVSCRCQLPLRRGANGVRCKSVPHYWEAAVLRFCQPPRYRADASTVSVQCPCASEKPPLCKGRWIGLGRAGGVVYSNPCGKAAHI